MFCKLNHINTVLPRYMEQIKIKNTFLLYTISKLLKYDIIVINIHSY